MRSPNLAVLAATGTAMVLAVIGVALADPMGSGSPTRTDPRAEASGTGSSSSQDQAGDTPVSDARGYPGTGAYCDSPLSTVVYGRTERAMVAICSDADGRLQYRGARRSDLASLAMPAGRTVDGVIVATNAGVTYAVSPTMMLVSEGDSVLYRDDWIEFRER